MGKEVSVYFPDTMMKKAVCEQVEYRVETQQLIDHIKTAIDVDDWAKAMAEELLSKSQIVRCRDCKRWSEENGSYYGRCEHVRRLTPFDWFCADGERKENE